VATKEGVLLWGEINRLTEICYVMEVNMEKAKVMRINLKARNLNTDYDISKNTGEFEIFQLFGGRTCKKFILGTYKKIH
jgi:hypothetical protein